MAQITIATTPDEQAKIVGVLKTLTGQTVAMSRIAKEASINPNRVRYIIADLEAANKIKRIPTCAFNEHYIRYTYVVLE